MALLTLFIMVLATVVTILAISIIDFIINRNKNKNK